MPFLSTDFFRIITFSKKNQEYNQSINQFGSRSFPKICWARSGSKLLSAGNSEEELNTLYSSSGR